MQRRQLLTHVGVAASTLGTPLSLWAQTPSWPRETVKLVVPFAAGGGTDRLARLMGQRMGEKTGKTFVVENRPGAGGNIGAASVAKANDQHTLLFTTASVVISPFLFARPGYDLFKDLAPIAHVSSSPLVVVVKADAAAKVIDDLRPKPGGRDLNYASPGIGTTSHLGGFLLAQKLRFSAVHVAYRGAGPAINALMSGEVDYALMAAVAVLPFIKNKQLRALAITGTRPLPDLATAPLLGGAPLNLELDNWQGMFAPITQPKPQLDQINTLVNETIKNPEVRATIYSDGATPAGGSPAQLRALLTRDGAKYGSIVIAAGVKPE